MEALRRTREFWAVRGLPRQLKILFLSNFFWASGLGLYLYIWPVYVRSLGASPSEVGLVLAVSTLVASVAFIPGGILADRYDRKRVMILGWSLALPAPLIFFYAGHWTHLLPGVLVYFASFLGIPAMTAYIADFSAPGERMTSFGFVYAGFPLGLTYSPALGAFLLSSLEMRHLFLIALIFYIASTLVMVAVKADPPATPREAGPSFSEILRRPNVLGVVSVMVVILAATYLAYVYIPLLLQDLHGASISNVQIFGTLISIGSTILAPILGRLADAWSRKGTMLLAITLFSTSLLLYVFARGPPALVLASLFAGTFLAFRSIGDSMITVMAPRQLQGKVMSLFLLLQGLALTLTAYLGGLFYEMSAQLPFLVVLGLLPPIALLVLLLPIFK
ncbi:MAG: MFS transporter [Thermoplasmata archaeon]